LLLLTITGVVNDIYHPTPTTRRFPHSTFAPG
jgi:hypothetical protein